MPNEITIKDLWDKMETMRIEMKGEINRVEGKVDDTTKAFHTFEAGRVTQLIQDVAVLKTEKEALAKKDAGYDKEEEKRRDRAWSIVVKVGFAVIGAGLVLIGNVLSKLNILNLT